VAFAASFLACAHSPAPAPPVFDPVTMDPPGDDAYPPQLIATRIDSHGEALNAIVYVAEGAGPHPTALLLHGLPGNERNLDLAQAIRRSGWNAVFFHYRGAWGSPGTFAFRHVLEDVAAAVAWTQDPALAPELRIDPERIALVGHSMGGFAALRMGGELDAVDCVVSIAGANLGARSAALEESPEAAAATAAQLQSWVGALAGTSGEAMVAELVEAGSDFDVRLQAPALAGKPLLLVAGTFDETTPPAEHHLPMMVALEEAGSVSLSQMLLQADHAFSQRRVALASVVTGWLANACR
jgi:uncharacterized protein